MSKILNDIGTLEWWISVFVVGVIINLFSTIFASWISKIRIKISKGYRDRATRISKEREELIDRLASNPHQLSLYRQRLITRKIDIIEMMLLAIFFGIWGNHSLSIKNVWAQFAAQLQFFVGSLMFIFVITRMVGATKAGDVAYEAETLAAHKSASEQTSQGSQT